MNPKNIAFTRSAVGALAIAVLGLAAAFSPGTAAERDAAPNRYVGAAKCKNCHQDPEAGDQYGVWSQEKHSQAYEVLASEAAKNYAKERGIGDPQKSDECLQCHVTAFGAAKENLHRSFDPKLGVQCETCHGPGEQHVRARMVAAAEEPAEGPAKPYTAIPDDEIVKAPGRETCIDCHNEKSPGYKPFCFHKFAADIRHVNPRKPRTDEEKLALESCACDADCVCHKEGKDGKCALPPAAGKTGGKQPEATPAGGTKK